MSRYLEHKVKDFIIAVGLLTAIGALIGWCVK